MVILFRKVFRDSRRSLLWLVIGLGIYGSFVLSFFPTIVEEKELIQGLINRLPEQFVGVIFSGDISEFDISDPAIFFEERYVAWMVLLVGGVLTAQALNAIIGAERDNTMDLALSLPVSRRQLMAVWMLNSASTIVVVLVASFVVFAVGSQFVAEFDIPLDKLAIGIMGIFFLLMAQVCLTYAIASIAPSSSHWAGPVAYGYFFGAYLLMALSNIKVIDIASNAFIYHYYNAAEVIKHGFDISNLLVLIGVIVVSSTIALWRFDQKELGI